jgi:hypothetical protein
MARTAAPKQKTSVAISGEARQLLALMAKKASISQSAVLELAIRERAKREKVTLESGAACLPDVDTKEAARQRFRALLEEAHRNATCDLTPEELEREVTLAHEEAREILRARRR